MLGYLVNSPERFNSSVNIAGDRNAAINCPGTCRSILNDLMGCPVTEHTDKRLFKETLDRIYINSVPASEYFNIGNEPDYSAVKEIEVKLAYKNYVKRENRLKHGNDMADKLLINGKPVSEIKDFKDATDNAARIQAMGNIIKQAFDNNMNKDNWLKPIMLVNEKGEPEPVKFTFVPPKALKKVEKLTGFARFMTGKETRAAYDNAYKEYPEKLKAYEEKMAVINRLEEYNLAADMKRAEGIGKLKGIALEVRSTNVDTLSSRQNGNTGTLPTVQPVNGVSRPQPEAGMSHS